MGMHRCGHHFVAKVLATLAWISAIIFWWTLWKETLVWMMDSNTWFQMVVVFVVLAVSTRYCWCGHGWTMMGKKGMMDKEGYCPACEGKGGEHTHEM